MKKEHLKFKEESNNKYETIVKELQEQKNKNDEMNKRLLKCKVENEQLLEKQKDERKEHDELIKELYNLKKQMISNRDSTNGHNMKYCEYDSEGTISICKYDENMIISKNSDKDKVNNLLKYLIKEKDKHQKKSNSVEKKQEILFMKKKEVTTKDQCNNSSQTEEDIFISNDIIDILFENGSLSSIELQNELESIPYIYFDIQYPTPNFERIYSEIIKLKKNLVNKINISIFYEGKENTDQRFHNDKEINMLRLGKSVKNIESSGNKGSFQVCSSLTSVSIPSFVTSIGRDAFYGCSSLMSISIPSSVTSIGQCAFSRCSSLMSVSILSSMISIGQCAFYGCSSLTSVSIPSSVTSFGECAFSGCTHLNDIKVESFKEKKINYLENKFLVFKSDQLNDIYDILLWVNPNNETIKVPGFIKTIGGGAFFECSSLTSVSIPSSVTSIGDCAFTGCSSLTSVSIPSSVKSIGDSAFSRCSSLTSVSIPSSVTSIGRNAFFECSSLTSVSIPSLLNISSVGFSQKVKITKI